VEQSKEAEKGTGLVKVSQMDDLTAAMVASPDSQSRILAYQQAQRIERTRILRAAAAQVAELSWGRDLAPEVRFALSRWCLEAGLDPLRHVLVLGGNVYDTAEYYMDRLASAPGFVRWEYELAAPLDVREISAKLVGAASVATELKKRQVELNSRRLELQMRWGVPSEINDYPQDAAAAVVTLHWADGTQNQGCNWAGSMGRKTKYNNPQDPVGDAHPVKTAVTRALRKAAKQRVPVWFTQQEDKPLLAIEGMIEQGREAVRRSEAERPMSPPGATLAVPSDLYGPEIVYDEPHQEPQDPELFDR
jgi:hypothetical protein